eukprot:IDg21491t1
MHPSSTGKHLHIHVAALAGLAMTSEELASILALHGEGLGPTAMAIKINRSRGAVRNYLKQIKTGEPKKKSDEVKIVLYGQTIDRSSCYNRQTWRKRNSKPLLCACFRALVQQILQEASHLQYKVVKRSQKLTLQHKKDREEWARMRATIGRTNEYESKHIHVVKIARVS